MLDWLSKLIKSKRLDFPKSGRFSISFSNMTGYVTIAEQISQDNLREYLNRYLSSQINVIQNNRGTVAQILGDTVMAFWGPEDAPEKSAQLVCETALKQMAEMEAFYIWAKEHRFPCPKIRIGIHSGEATLACLGAPPNTSPTILGVIVNVAKSIEMLAKEKDFKILVGKETSSLTSGLQFGEPVIVPSSCQPTEAYPLLGKDKSLT